MHPMQRQVRRIRLLLILFIVGLVLSGLTAFPLETELRTLCAILPDADQAQPSALTAWVVQVRDAVIATNARFPFLAYGTDWLAFAHLVIAIALVGPLRDPVRNVWVVDFALIACAAVIPMALIAGQVRGIPFAWRLIDCSFGVFGAIPLLIVRRMIGNLSKLTIAPAQRKDLSASA